MDLLGGVDVWDIFKSWEFVISICGSKFIKFLGPFREMGEIG